MKTVRELQNTLKYEPHNLNSFVHLFNKKTIDYDVYLPTRGFNLQRGYVWSIEQKREIINSILIGRFIPRISILCKVDESLQVIDGKQRLSAILGFYNNDFSLDIDNKEYYFTDLPIDYRNAI